MHNMAAWLPKCISLVASYMQLSTVAISYVATIIATAG